MLRGLLFAILLCIGSDPASAQLNQAGAYFQVISTSPRAHALGEATVALRGYSGALQLNPATIGKEGRVNLSTTLSGDRGLRTPWLPRFFNSADLWIASPSLDAKMGRWAGAYQWKEMNLGTHECRDEQNESCGTVRNFYRSHKLAAAYDLTPRLSIGAAANWIQLHFGGAQVVQQRANNATQFSLDFGVYYEHPFSTPYGDVLASAGWSLTDFGGQLRFEDRGLGDPLPMMMRGGLSLQASSVHRWLDRPIVTGGLHGGLSQALVRRDDEGEADGPFMALFTGWKSLTVRTNSPGGADSEFERVSAWDQLTTHAGLELSLLEILSMRWGSIQDHPLLGPRSYTSRGWELDLYYVALSRSEVVTKSDPYTDMGYWMLTARIPFEVTTDNFWPALIRELDL